MSIAFFDFDKTLISENSAPRWIASELREGRLRRRDALQAATWMLRYHFGLAELDAPMRSAIRSLAGTPEAELRERSHRFYRQQLHQLYRPGALRAVQQHRERGDMLVLVTASTLYFSEPVGEFLGLDELLCTRMEVDAAGLFTGEPEGTMCLGPGKLVLARELAHHRGVALADCSFYSDSFADVPLLAAVGKPQVVAPDQRLRRHADKAGWEIVDWG